MKRCSTSLITVVIAQLLRHVWLFVTPVDCSMPGFCPPPSPRACSNSHTLSWWSHPTTSPSVVPFSSCLHSFSASGSFPVSQLLMWGGQSIGASASVLPINVPSLVAQLCLTLCNTINCSLPGSSVHGDSLGKNTGVGCHALLQSIFPTQGSNSGFSRLAGCFFIIWASREAQEY